MLIRLFLLLLLQEGSSDTVEQFLEALNHKSIEVREKAAGELVRRGEAMLDPLRKHLEKVSDSEVRGRLTRIIRTLESQKLQREFKGGKVVDGLCAALEVRQNEQKDHFILSITIMNVGIEAQSFIPIETFNRRFPTHSFSRTDAQAEATFKALFNLEDSTRSGSGFAPRPIYPRKAALLKPGEMRTFELAIALRAGIKEPEERLLLPPGDYEFSVKYLAKTKDLVPNATDDVTTNTVKVTVPE